MALAERSSMCISRAHDIVMSCARDGLSDSTLYFVANCASILPGVCTLEKAVYHSRGEKVLLNTRKILESLVYTPVTCYIEVRASDVVHGPSFCSLDSMMGTTLTEVFRLKDKISEQYTYGSADGTSA